MPHHFDFLVLGGGSAGYASARTAREFCDRVAIVDGSGELGGLCILQGCMPSKTLIYSTEVLHLARQGEKFGLRIPRAEIDMDALQARKRHWVADFADYRREQLESDRFTLYRQHGRFIGPQEIELEDGTRIQADRIMVATGSVVNSPPLPGLADVPAWTSDDILDLESVPESVLVLGGGIIASELGQFLARAGSRVTLIQRGDHILREAGEPAARVVEEAFRNEGMEVFTGTGIQAVEETPRGIRVAFSHEGNTVVREAAHLLNALGRRPNTSSLNLSAAGLETGSRGHLLHDGWQQTNQPGIYTGGDCAGPVELVHIAIRQGEIAARHAFGQNPSPLRYDALMTVVFTDPQVAWVGLREDEALARNLDPLVEEYSFADHGKSLLMEAPRGYVKVIADRASGKIVGAECVGKDASELIHALTVPVAHGLTPAQCMEADWYHPTLAEIWTYPLEDLAEALATG